MKQCTKCLATKALSEFYTRKSGRDAGIQYPDCKECSKKRGLAAYHADPEAFHKRATARKGRIQAWIVAQKVESGCRHCGVDMARDCAVHR